MKYKLIALDLDGTLKNSNNIITPKNLIVPLLLNK